MAVGKDTGYGHKISLHKVGTRTHKTEIVRANNSDYTFLCDCGKQFTRTVKNVHYKLPMMCGACHKLEHTHNIHIGSKKDPMAQRDYTEEESDMISEFLKNKGK